jgi:hypothetical protein
MGRCVDFEPLIEQMLADEIQAIERDRLLRHSQSCASCRQFVELHHRLLGPELEVELPTDEEFGAARDEVLRRIRAEEEIAAAGGLRGFFRALWLRPAHAGALAALLLVALGAAFVAGRLWAPAEGTTSDWTIASGEAFPEIPLDGGVEDSPYLFTNVSLRDAGDGTMLLGFDVTRHIEVRRGREHPLVKEVLIQSLLNESSIGARLEAMSHAQRFHDPKVKRVLILTLLNDPNQAVRQRALEILTSYENDIEIETAMIAVLRAEESVHLRLMALDFLASGELASERLGRLVDDLERRQDRALLVRAASYLPEGARAPWHREAGVQQ